MKEQLNKSKRKSALTEKEVKELLDTKYKDCYPHTKLVIEEGFRKDPNFNWDKRFILKEDFLEQYQLNCPNYNSEYDFSTVPDIIRRPYEKIYFTNKDKTIWYVTTFGEFIISKRSPKEYFPEEHKSFNNTKEFIEASKKLHGNSFGYELVNYISDDLPIKLVCNRCGKVFIDCPKGNLNKKYKRIHSCCPACVWELTAEDRRKDKFSEFLFKAQEKFGDKFDYSKANYINGHTKILIYCKTCGKWFEQTPVDHLNSIYGCFSCGKKQSGKARIDRASRTFEEKGRKIHGDRFDYSKVEYVNNETEVIIIDTYRDNEEFLIKPQHHLKGYGNPYDSMSFGENCINNYLKNIGVKYTGYETTVHGIQGRIRDYVNIDFIFEHDGSKYWIEYHGMQHYRPGLFKFERSDLQTKEDYIRQVNRDNNVREYAKEHQGEFTYIEIPYTFNSWAKISKVLKAILIDKKKPEDVIKIPKVQPPKDI